MYPEKPRLQIKVAFSFRHQFSLGAQIGLGICYISNHTNFITVFNIVPFPKAVSWHCLTDLHMLPISQCLSCTLLPTPSLVSTKR